MRKLTVAFALALLSFAGASQAGTLFVAADTEDFQEPIGARTCPADELCDRLLKIDTSGATINSITTIETNYLINGMADAGGVLLAGTPRANVLNTVDFDGNLVSSIDPAGFPDGGCCNEEMLFVPTVGGDKVYQAHYSDQIREIDPTSGAVLDTFAQTDVVGMALINGEVWISKWAGRQIGIWNPDTNLFTSMINFGASNLGNAGALAWDPLSEVLWVGSSGGRLTPFALDGTQLHAAYTPFGATFGDTIDGATFIGEVTQVPEPGILSLLGVGLLGFGLARRRRREGKADSTRQAA